LDSLAVAKIRADAVRRYFSIDLLVEVPAPKIESRIAVRSARAFTGNP
jgi:hypothetical protein